MTDLSATIAAENSTSEATPPAPKVKVIITSTEGAELDAVLAAVARQDFESIDETAVLSHQSIDLPDGITLAEDMDAAIVSSDASVEYLWFLHADARPRPDALSAMVSELQRSDSSLGGSKVLVAGTPGELESIGSATDVFGQPYSGLDEGEIDLEQYDVVREVAFVSSVSMVVRRDVAQGLGGPDERMQPGAAGLDFSQRVRLTGGRVEIVPSSEVYHQGKCEEGISGWREEAGRVRAMLKAYRPLTLLWVLPYALLVSVLDSVGSLLLLRWQPLRDHVLAWLWNLLHLPSTILARRRVRSVRAVGDEELFRFQARGSVRLREVGFELSERILFMFDDDKALARGTRRVWSSPGIWGAALALLFGLFAARSILFNGVPVVGFSFPPEPPGVAFDRYLGGWNEAGLGSAAAVHPSTGITALVSFAFLGNTGAALTVMTLFFAILGVVGMGRFAGRLGYRGPGRYLAGLVLLAGPGTAALTGRGSWMALGAAALLPWAARSVFLHPDDLARSHLTHMAWAVIWAIPMAALSPVLALVPLVAVLVWRLLGGRRARIVLALTSLAGGLAAAGFLIGDPGWILDDGRRLGFAVSVLWPGLISVGAIPVLFSTGRVSRLASFGALLGLGGLAMAAIPIGGPGVEEAALVLASFGAAVVVAAGLDSTSGRPLLVVSALASGAMVVLSLIGLVGGRLGLPAGNLNTSLGFASTLAGEGGPGRLLMISVDPHLLPGEARSGPGFWYRTLDGAGTTLDEVWLPPAAGADEALDAAVRRIASGAELRPGSLLAEFAIEWLVVEGPPVYLEEILGAQLDLVPVPLSEESRIFENVVPAPMAADAEEIWFRDGTGFRGDAGSGRVRLSVAYDDLWSPDRAQTGWSMTVSAVEGVAAYGRREPDALLAYATMGLLLASVGAVAVERFRR